MSEIRSVPFESYRRELNQMPPPPAMFDATETPAEEVALTFLYRIEQFTRWNPLRWFAIQTTPEGGFSGVGIASCGSDSQSEETPQPTVEEYSPPPAAPETQEVKPTETRRPAPESPATPPPLSLCKLGEQRACGPCNVGISFCEQQENSLVWGICVYETEWLIRNCYTGPEETAGVGRCMDGVQHCIGSEWGECEADVTPQTESCNSTDDDCDGLTDEAEDREPLYQYFYTGPANTRERGVCRDGAMLCVGGAFQPIQDQTTPSAIEECDRLDNDCDGQTDEGVRNRCGQCATENPIEICDGTDNNCDGFTDEGVRNTCGACGPAPAERCDNRDNDCDGTTDEGVCGTRTGDSCVWDDQCIDGTCNEIYPNGYCTELILSTADGQECLAGTGWRTSVCVAFSEWGYLESSGYYDTFCIVTCETNTQCRTNEGYECKPIREGEGLKACLPHSEEVTLASGSCRD